MGMPNQILELFRCIYRENTSCVKVNEFFTRPFEITMGLHQGCLLSPLLFNLYIDDLPSYISDTHGGVRLGEMIMSCLLYADDLVILAENEVAMQALLKSV